MVLRRLAVLASYYRGRRGHGKGQMKGHIRRLNTEGLKYIKVETQHVDDYSVAIVTLDNPPVNCLTSELLIEFNDTVSSINDSKTYSGVVLSSALPTTFCAGLDLNSLYNVSEHELRQYWNLTQDCWFNIYTSPLPMTVAINGHCLAGGTIVAVATDYRVARPGGYSIGVTAAKIGLVAPPWFQQNIKQVVGHRVTELMLEQGRVFTPSEALGVGLVDEVHDDVVSRSVHALLPFMDTSSESRVSMKLSSTS